VETFDDSGLLFTVSRVGYLASIQRISPQPDDQSNCQYSKQDIQFSPSISRQYRSAQGQWTGDNPERSSECLLRHILLVALAIGIHQGGL